VPNPVLMSQELTASRTSAIDHTITKLLYPIELVENHPQTEYL